MPDKGHDKKETSSQMQLFEVEPVSASITTPNATKEKKTTYRTGNLYHVDLDKIELNPEQPRRYFDDAELHALAESIRTNGMLQPVLCLSEGSKLQLLAGERRLRAAKLANLPAIPVRIVTGDPLEIALIENLLRSDLTAVEEAVAIAALKEKKGFRLEDLSGITGKAVATLSEILSITRLPEEILSECRSSLSIPRDILVLIARLPGKEEKIAAFIQYMNGSLTRESLAVRTKRLKKVQSRKSAPFTYIRSVSKRFSRFDLHSMNNGDKTKLRNELEKLRDTITQTLDNLE